MRPSYNFYKTSILNSLSQTYYFIHSFLGNLNRKSNKG
jgi:hypothetical protein